MYVFDKSGIWLSLLFAYPVTHMQKRLRLMLSEVVTQTCRPKICSMLCPMCVCVVTTLSAHNKHKLTPRSNIALYRYEDAEPRIRFGFQFGTEPRLGFDKQVWHLL